MGAIGSHLLACKFFLLRQAKQIERNQSQSDNLGIRHIRLKNLALNAGELFLGEVLDSSNG